MWCESTYSIWKFIRIGALIDKNKFEGGVYQRGDVYSNEGGKSNHYGNHSIRAKKKFVTYCMDLELV